MSDHVERLADLMSERVRRKRLERSGYSEAEINGPHVDFKGLPEHEQQTWRDCAEAAAELFGTKGGAAEVLVQDDFDALAALEAVLAWAHANPDSTADGGSTGQSAQRGRVIATRVLPEGTIGVSTYESPIDAAQKLVEMEKGYRAWLRSVGKQPRDEGDPRRVEQALGIHEDFGGLVGAWAGDRALVARCGHGRIVELMTLTPLNALQLRRNLDELIRRGKADGQITDEHEREAASLPPMPASEYHPDYAPKD